MKRVLGAFEKISFPDFGIFDVIAKVDTGAMSGSMHATHIREVNLPTGEVALSFRPFAKKQEYKVESFERKMVKSSNGASTERYIIPTTVIVEGVQYPIKISLADRSNMMKGVLIGREFLRSHGFIVDPQKGKKYRYEVM